MTCRPKSILILIASLLLGFPTNVLARPETEQLEASSALDHTQTHDSHTIKIQLRPHHDPINDQPSKGGEIWKIHSDGLFAEPKYDIDITINGKKATVLFIPNISNTICGNKFAEKFAILVKVAPWRNVDQWCNRLISHSLGTAIVHEVDRRWIVNVDIEAAGITRHNFPINIQDSGEDFSWSEDYGSAEGFRLGQDFFPDGSLSLNVETNELAFTPGPNKELSIMPTKNFAQYVIENLDINTIPSISAFFSSMRLTRKATKRTFADYDFVPEKISDNNGVLKASHAVLKNISTGQTLTIDVLPGMETTFLGVYLSYKTDPKAPVATLCFNVYKPNELNKLIAAPIANGRMCIFKPYAHEN